MKALVKQESQAGLTLTYEARFRAQAVIEKDHRITATLPTGTTHYLFNRLQKFRR